MSKVGEKVAYLKGLAEGLGVNGETEQGKLMLAMIDTLEALAKNSEETDERVEELSEYVEEIDSDVSDLEEALFLDDEDEEDDDEAATVWSASARSIEGLRALVTPRCAFQSPVSRRYYVKHGRYCHKLRGVLRLTYQCWSVR